MSFHRVTVFHIPNHGQAQAIEALAHGQFGCQGIEEYALSEPEVDALLGERSYSGGDLPQEVLDEVDRSVLSKDIHLKIYFAEEDHGRAQDFVVWVKRESLCEVQLETLSDQDWNAEWKKHYSPIEVGSELVVLPEWHDPADFRDRLVVRIHPGMGFGTGSHETTHLCLKHFMHCTLSAQKQRVLDYGSGSGILGIAALRRFPAWEGDFVDIDEAAHHNCRQNFALNGIVPERARLLLVPARDQLDPDYPLVFANILQNILHQECDYLITKTAASGYLILSGLLKSQLAETRDHYLSTRKVTLVTEAILNDWGCLLLRKIP